MRITISTLGRFILLYLAQELERMGHLNRVLVDVYSGKQRWLRVLRRHPELVSAEKCSVFPWARLPSFVPSFGHVGLSHLAAKAQCDLFDAWASRHLEGGDVLVARSQVALNSFRQARRKGIQRVLFRGSAHIAHQARLIEEEHNRFNLKFNFNPYLRDKEFQEYEETDLILVPSTFAKSTFLQAGIPESRLIVAPHGVSTKEFHPADVPSSIRVLFAGGISLEKGIPYLMEAARLLKLGRDDVHLVGAMDPGCLSVLRSRGDRFVHHPPVSQAKLRVMYQSADVVVLPSVQDGFGLVLLEAMACARPVIATTHTAGPDLIADGREGYVVPPRDVDALASSIDRVLSSPERARKMGKRALRRAEFFTWRRSTEVFMEGMTRAFSRGAA